MMINLLSTELKLTLIKGLRIQLRNTVLGRSLSKKPRIPWNNGMTSQGDYFAESSIYLDMIFRNSII